MKEFTTTGFCDPDRNYMVDISDRMNHIREMVDKGRYFTINRARQYGKTTTLKQLTSYLSGSYIVVPLDFQEVGNDVFASEGTFAKGLARMFMDAAEFKGTPIPQKYVEAFGSINDKDTVSVTLDEIFRVFKRWCRDSEKPIVLTIDEIDSAANAQVFLDFLAMLRNNYLDRTVTPAFQSVILAGVTDIKGLRSNSESKSNRPWNIAADFNIDMSLPVDGIAGMLNDYENDHHTGMNIAQIAQEIHDYTSGYPFLVSRICLLIDTQLVDNSTFKSLSEAWTVKGVSEAVRRILMDSNLLFDSIMGKVKDNAELSATLQSILFSGREITFNPYDNAIADARAYGFIINDNGIVRIANRIFETLLYNYFLAPSHTVKAPIYEAAVSEKRSFIKESKLDMELILERYIQCFDDIYGDQSDSFSEEEGRRRFLMFIRPIINGTGNYYIEARTRNNERMDLVIDYLGERYVVEMKIWRGNAYNERGERQLADYLEHYHINKGYMLSYNFNKSKKVGLNRVMVGDKMIIEAVV